MNIKRQTEFLNSSGELWSIYLKSYEQAITMRSGLLHQRRQKRELGVPIEVKLTKLVKLEDCGVSLVHSIHHTKLTH